MRNFEDPDVTKFINEMIARRKKLGYTQKLFAEIIGTTKQAISLWENGSYATMKIKRLYKVLDKLGLRITLEKK